MHATLAVWRLSALFRSRSLAPCAAPLSQPGALRCPPHAARRIALSPSRSPAPCAAPPLTTWEAPCAVSLSDPPAPRAISHCGGALRCPPLAARRLAL
eukprot:3359120-Pleurochrysis_carterae.AAC.1